MPIAVAIVEDDDRIRQSLACLLAGSDGFKCVGCYASAEDALSQIPGKKPDVVLMDINLPGMSGIDCVAKLTTALPHAHILMLTVYDDSDRIFQALMRGATGYLVKRTPPARLLEAIQEAHQGGAPMSPHIARMVVQHFHRSAPTSNPTETLTERERQVLDQLARGYLYKEIADALGIGIETVRSHVTHIYEKLHVHTRTEATVKYLQSRNPAL